MPTAQIVLTDAESRQIDLISQLKGKKARRFAA
jgi:hypothetical protein